MGCIQSKAGGLRKGDAAVSQSFPKSPKKSKAGSAPAAAADVGIKVDYDDEDRVVDKLNAENKLKLALAAKRRGEMFAESVEPRSGKEKKRNSTQKSEQTREFLSKALQENILFRDLTEEQLAAVLSALNKETIKPGTEVITQGEPGDVFYVVEKGDFNIIVDDQDTGSSCGPGSTFGELALLYNCPRAATVKYKGSSDGIVWILDRRMFRLIVASEEEQKKAEIKKALRGVPLLADLNDDQLSKISQAVETAHFHAGETIIRKGDTGNLFFIIRDGQVKCTKAGRTTQTAKSPRGSTSSSVSSPRKSGSGRESQVDIILEEGSYFGERSLLTAEPRAANVIAITETDCLVLDREDFTKLLGPLRDILDFNLGMRVLSGVPLLSELSQAELRKLQKALKQETFRKGTTIIKQNDHGSKFYLIKEGEALVTKTVDHGSGTTATTVEVADLGQGDYFGEGALLKDEPRGANVEAVTDQVVCLTMERADFEKLLGPLTMLMKRDFEDREDETEDIVRKTTRAIEADIKLSDLKVLKTLGTGTFGRVRLAQCAKLNKTYALKMLQKAQVVAYRQQQNVINEKELLLECDHPFILKLYNTFKDKHALYFLLELVLGGELFTLLHIRGGALGNADSRFYAACVIDALEYMHVRTIVYRDLKPENLMIDAKGYIKVVDFGFAKKVKDKTYTLCGTPEYLSPELVLGKGHNKAVDNWAVGVLIFEMVTGASPFADPVNNDQMAICKNIVRGKVEFPRKFPEKAKDLVTRLLVSNAHMRLGSLRNGTGEIKEHVWFKSINFRDLYRCKIKAPWIPPIKDDLDTSNFDDYDEDYYVEPYKSRGSNWDESF